MSRRIGGANYPRNDEAEIRRNALLAAQPGCAEADSGWIPEVRRSGALGSPAPSPASHEEERMVRRGFWNSV